MAIHRNRIWERIKEDRLDTGRSRIPAVCSCSCISFKSTRVNVAHKVSHATYLGDMITIYFVHKCFCL